MGKEPATFRQQRVLITAGPTREPLDPVRYLSNRSSGRMGYALAEAARDLGHEVTLISGPVFIPAPAGVQLVRIQTASEMFESVRTHLPSAEVAIFAAAVADYRPKQFAEQKIKKEGSRLTLELERTEDILGSARSIFGFQGYLVGFAAETENLLENAKKKLERKKCDLIIANDVSQPGVGFDSSENQLTLCLANGEVQSWPQKPKVELAKDLWRFIHERQELPASV